MENKRKIKTETMVGIWCLLLLVFMVVDVIRIISCNSLTLISNTNVQEMYGEFLIKQNDEMITEMLNTQSMFKGTDAAYSEEEKEYIKKSIEKQNEIMMNIQKNAPDSSNKDYNEVYKRLLKTYSFYIQGELMQAEYIYAYKDEYVKEEQEAIETSTENYVMGAQLSNIFGHLILNNAQSINAVRNTNIPSEYKASELSDEELAGLLSSADEFIGDIVTEEEQ